MRDRVDAILGPFFSEPALWPVAIAVLGVLATFGAVLGLMAVRDRSPAGLLALAVVAVVTVDLLRSAWRAGRLGPAAWLLLALWGLSGAGAWLASHTGIF